MPTKSASRTTLTRISKKTISKVTIKKLVTDKPVEYSGKKLLKEGRLLEKGQETLKGPSGWFKRKFRDLNSKEINHIFEFMNFEIEELVNCCLTVHSKVMKIMKKNAKKITKKFKKKYEKELQIERSGVKFEVNRFLLNSV